MHRTSHFAPRFSSLALLVCLAALAAEPVVAQTTNTQIVGSGARVIGNGLLGKSMDMSEDYLVLGYGSFLYGSGATVLGRDTNGDWVNEAFFHPPGNDGGNQGAAVAVDGNRVVVGTTWDDEEFLEVVMVYEKILGTWQEIGALGNITGTSNFGGSVDISGDTVIVGAPAGGFIKIYHYDNGVWTQQLSTGPTVPAPGGGSGGFGSNVSIDGDVAVTGANLHPTDQVSIFRRTGTNWVLDQALSIGDMGGLASQGYSALGGVLAIDGDTVLAIVAGFDSSLDSGICVLRDSGSGYVFEEFFQATDSVKLDSFGLSIDLEGDNAIVSAPGAENGGSAYLFVRGANGFEEQAKYVSTAIGQTTFFGPRFADSVAIASGSVAFAAPRDISGGTLGAAYVQGQITSNSTIQAICAGNGSAGPTCANCPCGNNAAGFSAGGCLNSGGTSATLSMMGEARASADTMRLEVASAMPFTVALLFSGASLLPVQPSAPCVAGVGVQSVVFDGLRCVGGTVTRHGLRTTDATGRAGDTNDGWGGPFGPSGGLVGQGGFAIGQNRHFQAVYRDIVTAGCNTGLNTTNAISTMVIP